MDVVEAMIMTVGCIGCLTNGFAIYILLNLQKKFTATNLLILNQSAIDFLTSLSAIAFNLEKGENLPKQSNVLAELVCKIWSSGYLFWAFLHSSTYNLLVLTFDRYFAVMYPLKYNIFKEKIKSKVFLVSIPWITAFVVLLLWLLIHRIDEQACYTNWPSLTYQKFYGILIFTSMLIIPISVIFFVYFKIFRTLKNRVGEDSSLVSAAVVSRRLNIIKTMAIVCFTYVVCWTPNRVLVLIFVISEGNVEAFDFELIFIITTGLTMVNSCINPIIYTFKYNDFKECVHKKFKKCLCK
ncbi:kappa-type opioid receptor-like [Antedon mediterranea]|uniref:kappa-type opioid receptor-like n=1 Tax=Antedon mediterranea TaxID=105859 RepID=UPI003AF6A0ED